MTLLFYLLSSPLLSSFKPLQPLLFWFLPSGFLDVFSSYVVLFSSHLGLFCPHHILFFSPFLFHPTLFLFSSRRFIKGPQTKSPLAFPRVCSLFPLFFLFHLPTSNSCFSSPFFFQSSPFSLLISSLFPPNPTYVASPRSLPPFSSFLTYFLCLHSSSCLIHPFLSSISRWPIHSRFHSIIFILLSSSPFISSPPSSFSPASPHRSSPFTDSLSHIWHFLVFPRVFFHTLQFFFHLSRLVILFSLLSSLSSKLSILLPIFSSDFCFDSPRLPPLRFTLPLFPSSFHFFFFMNISIRFNYLLVRRTEGFYKP